MLYSYIHSNKLPKVIDYKLMAAPAVMDSGSGGGSHLSVAMPGSPKSGGGRGSSVRDLHFKTNNMTSSPQVSRHGQVQNMRKPLMVFDKSAAKEALIKRWRARLRWAPKVCSTYVVCVCRCTSVWQDFSCNTYMHTALTNILHACIQYRKSMYTAKSWPYTPWWWTPSRT